MIVTALLLSLLAANPESPPPRAELCLAHINAMIVEAERETGRVAGPSWFIRSWWTAKLPEDGTAEAWTGEQRTRLELSMAERKAADPEAFQAELQSCVDEAIEGGALP
ncbi:hypothetical protein [Brevundimonas sp.]|uniref:hypothetical protein n=1 Tax=Brevundimonas sp. TaxID=1871086 RepID=UPI002D54E055|nr:hypothetical protein [Brevundimonas sp.]HYC74374.1 hypothetical protein [Brevundimonas sp.]